MSTSLSDDDRKAIAEELKELLTSENPGVLVSRQTCDDRHNAIKTVVDQICTLSRIELIGVLVTLAGIIVTAILVVGKG